ncbi:hypothetical protein GWK08_18860 [Leptobacterium flavescens]|uniref:D-alanine--D-alanine ligase n=1 Tax=Leptobacterium flavescens TaxID=472055 RepID=A0A6P0UXV5_9FLAO|nr:hypothetical protein [Leptobacterium flavescens]NER15523.1 hypothetical protein [Leptobacterium flavescens]
MKNVLHKIRQHPFYIKCSSWEYWPMQFLYLPVYIQHLWLSLKARHPFFFLVTNPAIDEGFILSDSKYRTLQLVPDPHRPKSFLVNKNSSGKEVLAQMEESGISFPIILKPDIGYRGLLVHKLDDVSELEDVITTITVDHIVQEYIDFPVEIGVFYYRLPNESRGIIPSITIKEFLKVKGDGKHTLEELVHQNPRAILQLEKLRRNFKDQWNTVLLNGEELILEHIGNHNRGTKFVNANDLYDEDLQQVFDELNGKMKGFYFGRFDIRTKSIEDLKAGQNFKILEVNGVGAEPTHVYDPNYKLIPAWKEMLHLWRVIFKIAIQNKKSGIEYPSLSEGKHRWDDYRDYKKVFQ